MHFNEKRPALSIARGGGGGRGGVETGDVGNGVTYIVPLGIRKIVIADKIRCIGGDRIERAEQLRQVPFICTIPRYGR